MVRTFFSHDLETFNNKVLLNLDQPPSYDQVVRIPIETPATPAPPTPGAPATTISLPPSFSETQIAPKPA